MNSVDKRSDIYSFGAIWYTCLINQPPAGIKMSDSLDKILGITEDYKITLTKCLNNLEEHYVSTVELIKDLENISSEM